MHSIIIIGYHGSIYNITKIFAINSAELDHLIVIKNKNQQQLLQPICKDKS
jgi:hypothetical protein